MDKSSLAIISGQDRTALHRETRRAIAAEYAPALAAAGFWRRLTIRVAMWVEFHRRTDGLLGSRRA